MSQCYVLKEIKSRLFNMVISLTYTLPNWQTFCPKLAIGMVWAPFHKLFLGTYIILENTTVI